MKYKVKINPVSKLTVKGGAWCIAVMVTERLAKSSNRNVVRVRIMDAPFQ